MGDLSLSVVLRTSVCVRTCTLNGNDDRPASLDNKTSILNGRYTSSEDAANSTPVVHKLVILTSYGRP